MKKLFTLLAILMTMVTAGKAQTTVTKDFTSVVDLTSKYYEADVDDNIHIKVFTDCYLSSDGGIVISDPDEEAYIEVYADYGFKITKIVYTFKSETNSPSEYEPDEITDEYEDEVTGDFASEGNISTFTCSERDVKIIWEWLGDPLILTKISVTYQADIDETYEASLNWEMPAYTAGDSKYKVSVERTLTAGQWNSLCLPFSMSATEAASFGTIMKMTGIADNVVNFETATEISAGEMYIVKPTENVSHFEVTNKAFSKTVTDGYLSKTFGTYTVKSPMYYHKNIEPVANTDMYILGNSGTADNFYKVADKANMKATRWYIVQTTAPGAKAGLSISLNGETTGLKFADVDADANRYGKYIENGRLVISKNGKKFNAAGQLVK